MDLHGFRKIQWGLWNQIRPHHVRSAQIQSDQWGQRKSNLVQSWQNLVQSGAIWYNVVQFGTIWYNLVQLGTIWYNLAQFGAIWYNLVQFGTIWYNLVQFGTIVAIW